MTTDHTGRTGDVHSRLGAYVADALPEDERAEFKAHLAGCASCQHDVRGLGEAAAQLAATVAQPPPPELRGKVMTTIRQTRQLPRPMTSPVASPSTGHRWRQRVMAMAAAACLVTAVAAGVGGRPRPAAPPTSRRRALAELDLVAVVRSARGDSPRQASTRPVVSVCCGCGRVCSVCW